MKRSSTRKPRGHVVDALIQAVCEEFSGELEELAAEYAASYPNASPAERLQIDILIHSQWMWTCLNRVDTRIWNEEVAVAENPEFALGEAWMKRSADFMRVDRRTAAASREFYRALDELQRLRAAHKAAPRPAGPPREESKPKPKSTDLAGFPASRWVM
jgi:hypothetical protein